MGHIARSPSNLSPVFVQFHVVGFEGVVETDTSEYVHHLVVRGYHAPDCGMECLGWELDVAAAAENSTNFPEIPAKCAQVDYTAMFVWTPGVDGVAMPEEAGFRFDNSSGGFASVLVNTHFDNPNGDAGVVDSSGVRVYYTEKLRPMDMGMMILGDPFITLLGTPISNGRTSFSFGCPSSCTEEHFEVRTFIRQIHRNVFARANADSHALRRVFRTTTNELRVSLGACMGAFRIHDPMFGSAPAD